MEDFGNAKLDWFSERLELVNGIPSHDTFRRVFSLIEPVRLREVFHRLDSGDQPCCLR